MKFKITTFTNPFSFYCFAGDEGNNEISGIKLASANDTRAGGENKNIISKVVHGQYVAVYWHDKWVRGIVSMESQFQIWLVDYGIYIKTHEKSVCIDLAPEYRKIPSKVFEASIHGVLPIDKIITEECYIKDEICTSWNPGAIAHAKEIMDVASKVHFIPVAMLSTGHNDIVLGDLYLEIPQKGIINIIEELEKWPVFLKQNKKAYIENLSKCYTNRRRHRASTMKPNIPYLAEMTLGTSLEEYSAICANAPTIESQDYRDEDLASECSTVVGGNKNDYTLTTSEIAEYANMFVEINGREYNLLNILVNKIRDLNMCEKYKDHDIKGKGRGCRLKHY